MTVLTDQMTSKSRLNNDPDNPVDVSTSCINLLTSGNEMKVTIW